MGSPGGPTAGQGSEIGPVVLAYQPMVGVAIVASHALMVCSTDGVMVMGVTNRFRTKSAGLYRAPH